MWFDAIKEPSDLRERHRLLFLELNGSLAHFTVMPTGRATARVCSTAFSRRPTARETKPPLSPKRHYGLIAHGLNTETRSAKSR